MNYQRLDMKGPEGEVIKGNTPVHGANPYVDDYVGFTWNNVHSSSYNCFIENTGRLEFVGAPDFTNNFVSPAFQTRTYYTGMQNGSKKFSLNLVFYQLTLQELNAAFKWLDRTIVSDLFFDYEPYWKYSCKLASIGVMEKYVSGRTMYRGRPCDLYLCRVAVQFETVYHPEAISAYCAYKYSNDIAPEDPSLDFYDYSRTTGSDYMPFREYDYDRVHTINLADNEGQQLLTNDNQELLLPTGSKMWRPMILTNKDYNQSTPHRSYWRYVLKNPSAYPTYFKLHFYNVASSVSVYQYWNNDFFGNGEYGSLGPVDTDGWVLPDELDIDAYENSMCICAFNLNLDDDIWLDLHYNSEDGTVLCANQLIEQLRSGDAQIPCTYKDAVANVYLPGAVDSDHPSTIMLEITINKPWLRDSTQILDINHYLSPSDSVDLNLPISDVSEVGCICAGSLIDVQPAWLPQSILFKIDRDVKLIKNQPIQIGVIDNTTLTVLLTDDGLSVQIQNAPWDISYVFGTIYWQNATPIEPQVAIEYDTYEYMI